MKNLVVYSSITGNTKRIAEAIAASLQGSELHTTVSNPQVAQDDKVFVGFWCDKGHMDEPAKNFITNSGIKKVALFGTLGGDPKSEPAQNYLKRVLAELPSDIEVLAIRLWQGKVDPKVLEMMSRMPNARPMTPERKARLDEAAKHPTSQDCEEAARWAKDTLKFF